MIKYTHLEWTIMIKYTHLELTSKLKYTHWKLISKYKKKIKERKKKLLTRTLSRLKSQFSSKLNNNKLINNKKNVSPSHMCSPCARMDEHKDGNINLNLDFLTQLIGRQHVSKLSSWSLPRYRLNYLIPDKGDIRVS